MSTPGRGCAVGAPSKRRSVISLLLPLLFAMGTGVAGACANGCDDLNPCTIDTCVLEECIHQDQPDGLSCSDGDPCDGEETCAGGVCTFGTALDCNDNNPCTVDTCAAPDGCRNASIQGCCTTDGDCTDSSACTTQERCVAGQCTSAAVDCDDANPCTTDGCDPAQGCTNTPVINGIGCGDANVCNGIETCQSGTCQPGTPPNCNDGNGCTTDACDFLSGCTHQDIAACCLTDGDCADTSACTVNERCVQFACLSDPLDCNDSNPCTTDGCNPSSGCQFTPTPNGEACGGADFCAGLATCQAGVCQPGQPPDCNDGNVCTTDACNSATGCTHTPTAGCCVTNGDCLDNDPCTTNERCVGNACLSNPVSCNDGNVCTIDNCAPATGCVHTPVLDGTSCADAAACDGLETCAGGDCQPGTPLNCDDGNACTADSCVNATGCRHTALPNCCLTDAQCTDTDACTVNERCTAANACASTPVVCNDGNVCTADLCNAAVGCQNPPLSSGSCSDGDVCSQNDTCVGGSCAGTLRNCSDGNLCNGVEECNPTNGQCPAPGSELLCTPGSKGSRTCAAEWYAYVPRNPKGLFATTKECHQGDPTCDHDSALGTCTFRVGICFHLNDPHLLKPCTPTDVLSYRLLRPDMWSNPAVAGALLNALLSLPGAGFAHVYPNTITYSPALTQLRCTADVPLVVPVGAKLKVRGRTTTPYGIDTDSLLLICRP